MQRLNYRLALGMSWMIAILLAVVLPTAVLAQEEEPPETEEPEAEEMETDDADSQISRLTDKYDVTEEDVVEMRGIEADGDEEADMGWGEIEIALTLSDRLADTGELESDAALTEILSMREDDMGWGEIAQEMDTNLGAVLSMRALVRRKAVRLLLM